MRKRRDDESEAKAPEAAPTPKPTEPAQVPLGGDRNLYPSPDLYDRIVETIINIDPEAEAEAIKIELKLPVSGNDVDAGTLFDSLEAVQDLGRRSHALYARAYVDVERKAVDLRILEAALKNEARGELERRKKAGEFTKQITIEDVQNFTDTHFTDEVRALEAKKAANKMVLEHFEQIAKLARDRRSTLEALATGRRMRGSMD